MTIALALGIAGVSTYACGAMFALKKWVGK
jgi:hypothetical protein